ncbi:hypothetical protein DYB26_007595 [Aphanomyces astaci]|uniref:Ion transport domain-containing protein n=1 Tax=Aphanomyces astaci TaxID=112090 RepID=A0A397EGV4_APHAT|nr:hypothetical protein DYB38_009248 [Aphanomyces astaci]RHZ20302.1 hypothetical protein DYB26_007595 [Aphanomyces astaci]
MDAPWLGDPRGSREHVTRVSSRGLVDQQRRSIFILPEMRTQHQADGSTVKRQTISRRNSFLGHTIPFNKVAPVASLLSPTKLRKSKKSAKQRRKIPQDYDKHYRHSKITEGTAKFEDHANEWENYQLGGFIGVVNEVIATRKKEKALVTQWVIMPNSSFRKVWDIVLITNIDNVQPWLGVYIVDRVTDCIFLVDIVINFRSPEVSRKGDVTTFNANQVASAYLHSWFSLDLVSIIPFDYISLSFVTSTTTPSGVHLSRLPRLLRMFRLTKILKVVVCHPYICTYTDVHPHLQHSFPWSTYM